MSTALLGEPVSEITDIEMPPLAVDEDEDGGALLTSVEGIEVVSPQTRLDYAPSDLLEDLLRSDPVHALERLRSDELPVGFNLRGFGEGAATNAAVAETRAVAFLWGEAGILAFNGAGDTEREMALRALLATRYGPKAGTLTDPESIFKWLRGSVPSPADLAARARTWKERPREEIRALREFKNRISIVARLAETFPESLDDQTKALLDLRQLLP